MSAGRRAIFLDRDGTLIEDLGYPRDPAAVRLLPGAADAVRRLNESGFLTIVVTNQSGIARGLLTEAEYLAVEQRVDELLARAGARLDAHYFCPHLPEITGPCECRKPGPLLYRQAAERFGIDLAASWWVGDRPRDVLPAEQFGGHGILVLTGHGAAEAAASGAERFSTAADIAAAVERILAMRRDTHPLDPPADPPLGPLCSPPMTMRVAVAVSGRGSNLEALLRALGPAAPAQVVLVLSNRADAPALDRARERGIASAVLSDPADAAEWLEQLERHRADLVVLAGYIKLVPAPVIERYRGRVINVHPALLPAFGGQGMYGRRVHEAVLASGARESGATVHLVDEAYDRGPILAQGRVPVYPDDTPERLAARVLEVEHRLLPAAVLAAAAAGHPVPFSEPVESTP